MKQCICVMSDCLSFITLINLLKRFFIVISENAMCNNIQIW